MSWCCLALRSSAEQNGNKAKHRKWLKSLVCEHAATIRLGKTSPKRQPAGARAQPRPHARDQGLRSARPTLISVQRPVGIRDSVTMRMSCSIFDSTSAGSMIAPQAVSLQLSPDDRNSVSVDSKDAHAKR
jgi:hypothetical protein